jgi:hypothetical protein
MNKRYSSSRLKFTINLKIDGEPLILVFKSFDQAERRRYTIVSDPKIQAALEANKDFNAYFTLDLDYHDESEEVPVKEHKPTETQKENVKEVQSLAEAKKYLASISVRVYPSMNKGKAIEAAKERGIELIIKN